jgi:hypothetical protein
MFVRLGEFERCGLYAHASFCGPGTIGKEEKFHFAGSEGRWWSSWGKSLSPKPEFTLWAVLEGRFGIYGVLCALIVGWLAVVNYGMALPTSKNSLLSYGGQFFIVYLCRRD